MPFLTSMVFHGMRLAHHQLPIHLMMPAFVGLSELWHGSGRLQKKYSLCVCDWYRESGGGYDYQWQASPSHSLGGGRFGYMTTIEPADSTTGRYLAGKHGSVHVTLKKWSVWLGWTQRYIKKAAACCQEAIEQHESESSGPPTSPVPDWSNRTSLGKI